MSIATPALDALRDTLPDDLKDIRLNLASVLAGENLAPAQALGTALASARFLRCRPLVEALESDLRAGLGDAAAPVLSDALASAGTNSERLNNENAIIRFAVFRNTFLVA